MTSTKLVLSDQENNTNFYLHPCLKILICLFFSWIRLPITPENIREMQPGERLMSIAGSPVRVENVRVSMSVRHSHLWDQSLFIAMFISMCHYPGMGDLRFYPEFRFFFGGKYCIFFSNSTLISSLQVFFSFPVPIPDYLLHATNISKQTPPPHKPVFL